MKDTNEEDKEALKLYESLFVTCFEELCAYAYSYIPDMDTAKDIVQESFLHLWKDRHKYQLTRALLYTTVRNTSLNHLKSSHHSKRAAETPLDSLVETLIITQEDRLNLQNLTREIRISIHNLPPQCKKIFLMSRKDELPNKEIAAQLEISVKAVEKQMTKAISCIREHLRKAGLLSILLLLFILFQK